MEHKCEYENCTSTETEQYTYPVEVDGEPVAEYLCWEHADKQGFCPACGYFVAGSGDENWRGGTICYECYRDFESEMEGDDDYEDYDQ
jgi:hypothetical protein